MKIRDLEKGMRLDLPLLVSQVTKGVTQNGAPYLSITLQDNSGSIEAKFWDVKSEQEAIIKVGEILDFKVDVLLYRQNLQLRIHDVSKQAAEHYNLTDFVQSSEYDVSYLKEQIEGFVSAIENQIIKDITVEALSYYGDKFYQYPAATRNHHDFVGGLATHVYGMGKLANSICDLYPIYNRDLLMAGVILHDLGKIEEYDAPLLSQYTPEGRLIGHISIMHTRLTQIVEKLGYENTEEALILRHMVLSHHGELEYGSPVLPMVKEAEMLNFIDNIDARTNMFEKFYPEQEEGTFSPRMFALDNRNFYKAKGVK